MKVKDLLKTRKPEKAGVGVAPYIEIGDIDIDSKQYAIKEKTSVAGAVNAYEGEILVSTVRPTRGAITVVNEKKCAVSGAFAILRPNTDVCEPRYLFFLINSKPFLDYLGKNSKGATYPTCSKEDVLSYEIETVNLKKQKKICNELECLSKVIELRKLEIQKLDELVKARFVEMFGDPVINEKEYQTVPLGELGKLKRGTSKHRPRNDAILLGGPYPLIQTGDVSNADTYITTYNSTYSEAGLKQSKMWNKGTLCITIAANIADTAVLGFDACFPDSVVGFTPYERVTTLFIHNWFKFLQPILEENAPSVAQKNLNVETLEKVNVIVPSMNEQLLYEEFLKQVDKSKVVVQKALDEAQLLFDSLMQKYFG